MNFGKILRQTAISATILGTSIANLAHASNSVSGFPSVIFAQSNGDILFTVDNHPGAYVDCATTNRYAINVNTPAGQALYSMILTSLTTKTPITVYGASSCNIWPDSEDIAYIRYNQ